MAIAAALAMLWLDQLTKGWALLSLRVAGTTVKLTGPVDLPLLFNRSNAFGLIPDYGEFSRWALIAVSIAAAAILLGLALRTSTSSVTALGLAFISAGALGNAIDRVRLGAVVDLFDASVHLGFQCRGYVDRFGVGLVLVAAVFSAGAPDLSKRSTGAKRYPGPSVPHVAPLMRATC